ncbi:hypothetical protein GCM10023340_35200 [Nocardioides marinquilinus]|uniref:Peptidase M48 domain-containing protein n=1 Tax=Nocardioides marinquilinus TaxID=1210400 RepID=A0ABP9PXZ8_9ACTN
MTVPGDGRSRRDAFHDYAGAALDRRLVDEVVGTRRERPRLGASTVVLVLMATAVHLVLLALVVTGVGLLAAGSTWVLRVLGVVALLAAVAMVAAPGVRVPRGSGLLGESPALAGLVEEVAGCVGGPTPHRVELSPEFTAFVTSTRTGRRVLTIGAPLWVALGPQARVALLGHELGHFAHRDVLSGRYVGAAMVEVRAWLDVLAGNGDPDDAAQRAMAAVTWPVRAVLTGYLRLMTLLDGPSRRRQEVFADLASVRVAGTAGAVDLLETVLAEDGVVVACNRTAVTAGRPPLRPAIEAVAAGLDDARRAGLRRAGASRRSRIDDSHPATVERLRLVEGVERREPAVVLDAAREREVEAQLAPHVDDALRWLAASFLSR